MHSLHVRQVGAWLCLGGDTAAPSRLYARLCHTFLVVQCCWFGFNPGLQYAAEKNVSEPESLRYIVIDGSNVAMM